MFLDFVQVCFFKDGPVKKQLWMNKLRSLIGLLFFFTFLDPSSVSVVVFLVRLRAKAPLALQ